MITKRLLFRLLMRYHGSIERARVMRGEVTWSRHAHEAWRCGAIAWNYKGRT